MRIAVAGAGLILCLAAFWFLVRPDGRTVIVLPTTDGGSELTYRCRAAFDGPTARAAAQRAHDHFQEQLSILAVDEAKAMLDIMEGVASTSNKAREIEKIDEQAFASRRALVDEVEERFGCTVSGS